MKKNKEVSSKIIILEEKLIKNPPSKIPLPKDPLCPVLPLEDLEQSVILPLEDLLQPCEAPPAEAPLPGAPPHEEESKTRR